MLVFVNWISLEAIEKQSLFRIFIQVFEGLFMRKAQPLVNKKSNFFLGLQN